MPSAVAGVEGEAVEAGRAGFFGRFEGDVVDARLLWRWYLGVEIEK